MIQVVLRPVPHRCDQESNEPRQVRDALDFGIVSCQQGLCMERPLKGW